MPEQGEMFYEVKTMDDGSDYLTITLPEFTFPHYITLRLYYDRYCTVVGSKQTIEDIAEGLADGNPIYYFLELRANEITVGWTNREPYASLKPYSEISKTAFFSNHSVDSMVETFSKEFYLASPLEAYLERSLFVPPWSMEETQYYEERLQTFIKLTDHYYENAFPKLADHYRDSRKTAVKILPDEVWRTLPSFNYGVFAPASSPVTVKIIPQPETRPALMRQFFESLSNLKNFFAFAINATGGAVSFELQYEAEDASLFERQIALHFPDYEVIQTEPFLEDHSPSPTIFPSHFIPLHGYSHLKTINEFHIDPYRHICEVFNTVLDRSEHARFEIFCKPLPVAAVNVMIDYFKGDNHTFRKEFGVVNYPDEEWSKDTLKAFQKKLPAWGVIVTWSYTGYEDHDFVLNSFKTALRQYETVEQQWQQTYYENWNIISLDELVSLAHFPTQDLNCDRLELSSMKAKLPPPLYTTGQTRIGTSEVRGQRAAVYLPEEVRDRHVYMVGKSGTGKSTLLETIIRADIEAGRGAAIIDPHGDMIRHLMEAMPEHRIDDCIYFSPKHSPVSLEILAADTEYEIDLLTDDLVMMFRRTSESWGDKMQAILQMTFQTLLRVPGSSFTDVTPLLTDKAFRAQILSKINHPQLQSFWENRYDARQAEPILIRMDRLSTSSALRGVLTQHKNSLNFYDVIRQGKIFLADVSKGDVGESTSHLLGSIIVSQIQLASMRQAQLPPCKRVPFSLFVDEVQNFTTGAFSTILSEARKYKLRLTVAHQFVSQLPADIQKAIFGNVGTLVFFGMSPDDLGAARYELGTYEPSDVANLPKYHALCRPSTAARDTFSFATLAPTNATQKEEAERKRVAIIDCTQKRFASPPVSFKVQETEPQAVCADKAENISPVGFPVEEPAPVQASELSAIPAVAPPEEPVPEKTKTISADDPAEESPVFAAALPQKSEASTDGASQQHRYLQSLVKRMAESRGFLATVEKEVFGGAGRVDVALENETRKIACEISVTNEPAYELQNIRKCLAAEFSPVVVISADARHLDKIRRLAEENLSEDEFSKTMFFSPEEFHSWIENLEIDAAGKEEKVKGFRVNVKLKPVDEQGRSTAKKAISDVVFGAMKKLKKEDENK